VSINLPNVLDFFQDCFKIKTYAVYDKALLYLKGLFKIEKNRANCCTISETIGELNNQSLNHFISNSPWDYKKIFQELPVLISSHFDAKKPVALLIDEVGFRKKGKNSACVGRQYLGCIGKNDNGQVAVVAGLSQDEFYCPITAELFMPESWNNDNQRRDKCGIPESIQHKTKPTMALEMILGSKKNNVNFDFVNFDALYGSSIQLLDSLIQNNILFMGDIRENMKIYQQEPLFYYPKTTSKKGRKRQYPITDAKSISVRELSKFKDNEQWREVSLRTGTNGVIKASFYEQIIWICSDIHVGRVLKLKLLIRRDDDGKTKYSLSNMMNLDLFELAKRQGQRVFIEKIFEEGKNQVGLGDYQVRSWDGFHKHLAIRFIGLFYFFYQKITNKEKIHLTAPIIKKLVASSIKSNWDNPLKAIEMAITHLEKYFDPINSKPPS
jgi:SRSO17 transposase